MIQMSRMTDVGVIHGVSILVKYHDLLLAYGTRTYRTETVATQIS